MKKALNKIILIYLLSYAAAIPAAGNLTLTTGVDYSSGKYGQSESTDITYIPIIAKYEINNDVFKLTVPWLQIRGPGNVIGGDSTTIVLGKSNRPITVQSGLGDVVVSGTHRMGEIGDIHPFVFDLTGKIKFATASASKGLGTGENDYSLQVDSYKPITTSTTLFGDIGYKYMGDPDGISLNNVWFGSAGLSYKIDPASTVGIIADYRQATQNTTQSLRELTVFISHKFKDQYKLQSYITHGYTDSSTDWGGGVMFGWMF